jgi:ABC-type lipoprotein export system ATPase subunit
MFELRDLSRHYHKDGSVIKALDQANLRLEPGDFAVIQGPSGSGKSTLLLLAGGLLSPTSGGVLFQGVDIHRKGRLWKNRFRKRHVSFIFQKFHLMPYLTVYDNIRIPLALQGRTREADRLIRETAESLQIAPRLGHYPPELSSGEQQRVALARSLVSQSELILADEPTGNLDPQNAEIIARRLTEESKKGRVILLVTHEREMACLGNRQIRLENGRMREIEI